MTADYKGFKGIECEFTFGGEKQFRQLFIQKHSAKRTTDDKPNGKTLFIVNIPPYIIESHLKSMFENAGIIENVVIEEYLDHGNENAIIDSIHLSNNSKYFHKTKRTDGFKIAFIVFKQTKSLEKALRLTNVKIDNEIPLNAGIKKWTNDYFESFIDEKQLQAEVNDYMLAFEEKEQEEREEARKTEIDEDGWTIVKRGKVGGGFQQKESVLKALEDKMEKGKEKKEFKNFYAFQIRESKQKHIVSLRKRFEEDKLKINALKKARRFKPF